VENKQKKTEIRVYFSIYPEDMDPEKLTELIGLKPSSIHLKGDSLVKDDPKSYRHKENLWEIKSHLDQYSNLQDHVINALEQLRPFKRKIIEATRGMHKELAVTIFFSEDRPPLHLDKNIIKELAEYGAEVDFDVYFRE
jgi:hypothetical protein